MSLSVQTVVIEKEDASHTTEMYTLAGTFLRSNPFHSLNCGHFCATRPAVVCLSRMVNARQISPGDESPWAHLNNDNYNYNNEILIKREPLVYTRPRHAVQKKKKETKKEEKG